MMILSCHSRRHLLLQSIRRSSVSLLLLLKVLLQVTAVVSGGGGGSSSHDGNEVFVGPLSFYLEASNPNMIAYSDRYLDHLTTTSTGSSTSNMIDLSQLEFDVLSEDFQKQQQEQEEVDGIYYYVELIVLALPPPCTVSNANTEQSGCHWTNDFGLGAHNKDYDGGGETFYCCTPEIAHQEPTIGLCSISQIGQFIINNYTRFNRWGRYIRHVPLIHHHQWKNNNDTKANHNNNNHNNNNKDYKPTTHPTQQQGFRLSSNASLIQLSTPPFPGMVDYSSGTFVIAFANCNAKSSSSSSSSSLSVFHVTGHIIWKLSSSQHQYGRYIKLVLWFSVIMMVSYFVCTMIYGETFFWRTATTTTTTTTSEADFVALSTNADLSTTATTTEDDDDEEGCEQSKELELTTSVVDNHKKSQQQQY